MSSSLPPPDSTSNVTPTVDAAAATSAAADLAPDAAAAANMTSGQTEPRAPDVTETVYVGPDGPVSVVRLNNFSIASHLRNLYGAASSSLADFFPPSFGLPGRGRKQPKPVSPPAPYETPPADGSCPIDRLPNELLADIFLIGADMQTEDAFDDDEDDDDDDEEDDKPPSFVYVEVLVSHVCRRWRSIALSTPTLWNCVAFGEGPPFELSKTYISRSREAPLNITIDCTLSDDDDDDDSDDSDDESDEGSGNETEEVSEDEGEEVDPATLPPDHPATGGATDGASAVALSQAALDRGNKSNSARQRDRPRDGRVLPEDLPTIRDMILPHVGRWRSFELMVSSFAVMHATLRSLSSPSVGPALELRELLLYDYGGQDDDPGLGGDVEEGGGGEEDYEVFRHPDLKAPLAPFGGVAPNLVHVVLWGVHLDWDACAFLSGLEALELAYHAKDVRPSYATFARILSSSSTTLRRLTIALSGPAGEPSEWPGAPIALPTTDQLALNFLDPARTLALLARLHLPSLKHLAIESDPDDFAAVLHWLADGEREREGERERGRSRAPPVAALESLKLGGLQADDGTVREFYGAMPVLETLELDALTLGPNFVSLLLPPDSGAAGENVSGGNVGGDGDVPLRALHSLTTTGIDGPRMREIVEGRERAGVPLKRVAMATDDDVSPEEEAWLRSKVDFARFVDEDNELVDDDSDEEVEFIDDADGIVIESDGFTDEESGSGSGSEDSGSDEEAVGGGEDQDPWGPD